MIALNTSLPSQNPIWVPAARNNTPNPREGDVANSSAGKPAGQSNAPDVSQSVGKSISIQAATSEENPDVVRMLRELEARDREVRAHEQAHMAAGGAYVTSGPSYVYQKGPDGQRYAIGGEVGIDTSPVKGDPQATIEKALAISRAALAPAQPSGQDLKVAQQAAQMLAQAQSELITQRMTNGGSKTPDGQRAAQEGEQQKTAANAEAAGQRDASPYRSQQATQAYSAMARLAPESASERWQAIA